MIKPMLSKIQKLEKEKQDNINKIAKIQSKIDDLDIKLKQLYSFKKDYEKLENKVKEFLNNL